MAAKILFKALEEEKLLILRASGKRAHKKDHGAILISAS
jgi:hypothetical protein